jgi:undecaprenyl-diphosphatase
LLIADLIDLLLSADAALRAALAAHHSPALDLLMLAASAAGRFGLVWIALALVAAMRRPARRRAAWQVVLAVLVAAIVATVVLKPLVARPRPFVGVTDVRVIGERLPTWSFPSGHAAESFAGAFALARAWPAARVAGWLLAALIAFSRVYLGVHYPFDVIGGALVGLACAGFVVGRTIWYTDEPV